MIYQFCEPHPTGGDALIEITEEQIRVWMRKAYPNVKYEDQIEEFCTLHWAWAKNESR